MSERSWTPLGSLRRVSALVLRHVYVLRTSWPRILELAYWPMMQVIVWGFISQFLRTNSSWVAQAAGVLIAAALLWDVLFRAQLGVSISFLEEMWSRNLGNLFVSPLRPWEMVLSMMTMSLLRTLIGMVPAALIAIPFYHYSIFSLGLPLLAFFFNLMVMGWCVGIVVAGAVLRFGMAAESFAWVSIFAFAPVSGIYYPISTLPEWLRPVAWALPSSYVFEGMRAVMFDHIFPLGYFFAAVGLNSLYLTLAGYVFVRCFGYARQHGKLLSVGE
jgi:ABC-2 type transport system permease protein